MQGESCWCAQANGKKTLALCSSTHRIDKFSDQGDIVYAFVINGMLPDEPSRKGAVIIKVKYAQKTTTSLSVNDSQQDNYDGDNQQNMDESTHRVGSNQAQ